MIFVLRIFFYQKIFIREKYIFSERALNFLSNDYKFVKKLFINIYSHLINLMSLKILNPQFYFFSKSFTPDCKRKRN